MVFDYPGKRPSGIVYDLAYGSAPQEFLAEDNVDESEQKRQERDLTRDAIRHVIEHAVVDLDNQNDAEVARDA